MELSCSRPRSMNAIFAPSGDAEQGQCEGHATRTSNQWRRACHAVVDRTDGNIKLHSPGKRRSLAAIVPLWMRTLSPTETIRRTRRTQSA